MLPPAIKKIPRAVTLHGDTRIDNYFWLREKHDPVVLDLLKNENAYTETLMGDTQALQHQLYQEMVSRIQETDVTVPYPQGSHLYYAKTFAGRQYPEYYRKDSHGKNETALLNLNEIAKAFTYLSLGFKEVSPDENLLAYSLDTNGSEVYTLFIKNIANNQNLPVKIENVAEFAWASDNKTFFYTIRDESLRPYRVYRHEIGKSTPDGHSDTLIFEESDHEYTVSVTGSKNEKWIFIVSGAGNATEYRFLPADAPLRAPQIISPRQPGHEYAVEAHADDFYILTNANATNFRLVKTAIAAPAAKNWQEVLPHHPDVTLKNLEVFKNHIVVLQRKNGLGELLILNPQTRQTKIVTEPEESYSIGLAANAVYDAHVLRYEYTSLTTPTTTLDYDLETGEKTVLKVQPVLGGYDPKNFVTKRLWIASHDGVRVPVSLVYQKTLDLTKPQPLFLTGYGSYGICNDVYFSSVRLSLLERGVIFAVAHIRGGGDLGEGWRLDGKMLKKKNTFADFIACAEGLIQKGYTARDRLVIQGGSAGGLLMGAVVNARPDLFKAVIADVPFVDCLNTMLDETLPLTTGEYVEWGNPNEKNYYDYLKSYCPYTNVAAKPYPTILVKSGLNDPRVAYWEGAKWAAKLREHTTSQNPILLKTNMGAGHGGSSGRYDKFKEIAFDYAFVLKQLEIA